MTKHQSQEEHKEALPAEKETEKADEAASQSAGSTGGSSEPQAAQEGQKAAEAAPVDKVTELEAKCAELAEKLAETHDQFLRKTADFENFRKRMNQEKMSAIEYANQNLLLDIIPVIDDFERAILSAEKSKEFAGFFDGICMIEKQLLTQLENKWGLKRYNSAGEPFDPNRHEALLTEKSADISEPTVHEDLMKGYLLKERVIRAAKVKVLMPE